MSSGLTKGLAAVIARSKGEKPQPWSFPEEKETGRRKHDCPQHYKRKKQEAKPKQPSPRNPALPVLRAHNLSKQVKAESDDDFVIIPLLRSKSIRQPTFDKLPRPRNICRGPGCQNLVDGIYCSGDCAKAGNRGNKNHGKTDEREDYERDKR